MGNQNKKKMEKLITIQVNEEQMKWLKAMPALKKGMEKLFADSERIMKKHDEEVKRIKKRHDEEMKRLKNKYPDK